MKKKQLPQVTFLSVLKPAGHSFKSAARLLWVLLVCCVTIPLSAQDPEKKGSQAMPGNDKPTFGNRPAPVKTGDDDQSREIKDVFAANAVTYEEMVSRAKYQPYMPGEIVIAIELQTAKANAAAIIRNTNWPKFFGGRQVTLITRLMTVDRGAGRSVSLAHLKLPEGLDVFEAMKMLQNQQGILWSSPNFRYEGDPRDIVPNDPSYSSQYHHPLMKNNLAWDVTFGSANIIVAVTDDGAELTHSDLAANIWVNPGEIAGDGIDNDNNGYIDDVNGWDFAYNNNNPGSNSASDSHGTHVAGIIGARVNNNIGVAGVAGLTTVMPVQFYSVVGGAAWTATQNNLSFTYAIDNGAKIVNTSYNIDGFASDPVFIAGVQYVLDAGGLHFNSAGNNNELNPPRQAVTHTLLVASTDAADVRSSFSNYGTGVDISAPGSNILSTVVGNTYQNYSGTSMATPNAAGAAALIWAAHPTWTNYQVAAQLLATADDIYPSNPTMTGYLGSGRVNTFAGVSATIPAPKIKSLTGLPAEGSSGSSAGVTGFSVQFTQVMDPATVNNMANYELRNAGPNGTFGDADDLLFAVTSSNVYRVGTNQMNYQFSGTPLPCGLYRFSIASGGLRNPFSTSLDGDGNGTAGDAYVRNFTFGSLVFPDTDGDGYGTGTGTAQFGCTPPSGFALVGGDCDDNNPDVNPGETEICGNAIDDNCDGYTDFIPGPAGTATTFSNIASIVIPASGSGTSTGAPSNPYPSNIIVSGVQGPIATLKVKLNQFSHTYPQDIDFLLVSPTGRKMTIMSDVGGTTAVTNVNLVLDDAAAATIPVNSVLTSGTYRPSNSGATDPFPAPAPAGPYQLAAPAGTTTLNAVFGGESPNGTWSLYVVDDASGDIGNLVGGWELVITTLSNLCDILPNPTVSVEQPTCTTATGTITIDTPTGVGYTFSIGNGYQVSNVFSNVLPGSYQVTVKNADDLISPATTVVIDPQPQLPATPDAVQGLTNVCQFIGTATQLTYTVPAVAGATSYNWTVPPTVTLVSGQGTNSITVTINANFLSNVNRMFRVTASSGCGTSGERLYWLMAQLATTPLPIVASTNNVCPSVGPNVPITFTIPKVPAASSYIWTAQAGTTTISHPAGTGPNDTTISVTFTSAFTTSAITVQSVNDCGISGIRSYTLIRNNPSTPSPISGPTNVCAFIAPGGEPATYSVPAVAGVTNYFWTLPLGSSGIVGQGNNSISFRFPAGFTSGVISVIAFNGCGTSTPRTLAVSKLNPASPGVIDVVNSALCPNREYTYSLAGMPSNAASVQWTIPTSQGAVLVSGQGTASITVTYPSTAVDGLVTAQAVNNCGTSVTRSTSVKLAACPVAPPPPPFSGSNGIFYKGMQATSVAEQMNVNVYPNPSATDFNMQVITAGKEEISVRVLDVQGRELKSMLMMPNTTRSFGNELKKGTYLVEVLQGHQRSVKKLIRL